MNESDLNLIQKEILKALEALSGKALFTEAIVAKKIRETCKITGNKKAGIAILDIEKAIACLAEKNIFYSVHVNSANDLLFKKSENMQQIDSDARKRRVTSEKSMSILSSSDIKTSSNKNTKKLKKRTERTSININDDFENVDY
ncbi:MAG: hypothetical protein K6F69_09660 [Treponema sp.]|nr:hypothetical protein [Treponema sp.]